MGAVSRLADYRTHLCLVVSFLSRMKSSRAESRRRMNASDMSRILEEKQIGTQPRRVKADPYDPVDLLLAVGDELTEFNDRGREYLVTVDITCFTKIQLLFLLRFLYTHFKRSVVRLLYTMPQYYSSLDRRQLTTGYDRLVIAPYEIASTDDWSDKGLTMALLLGHEGTRTIHAWTELEPEETVLIKAVSEADPEQARIADKENETLLTRAAHGAPDFRLYTCAPTDISRGTEVFSQIVKQCSNGASQRLAFVPLGPKPLVAAFALSTVSNGSTPIDIVYPVPQTYSADYSIGVGRTYSHLWGVTPPSVALRSA
jgi:hypothetical protein